MSGSYVALCDADRERLGAPEKLYYELADIEAWEQAALQQVFRYHSPEDLADAMRAMIDEESRRIRQDQNVYLALAWLGLRQAGLLGGQRLDEMVNELGALRIKLARTQLGFDGDDAPGKDESSTPTRTSTA